MNGARLRSPVDDSDHVLGRADAAATLVEYGDYECSFCGRAFPVVEAVRRELGEDLRFAFRHFPLYPQHPHALPAARAAEAAAEQGRFWPMHRLLYTHQGELETASLYGYAEAAGLDLPRFERDLRSPLSEARVQADLEGGLRSGVNGTPTFFINGIRFDGDWQGDGLLEALRMAAGVGA